MPIQYTPTDVARFWAKINKTDTCWLWTGGLNHGGYGAFNVNGHMIYVHRFAFEIENGPIPDGMLVCHVCDVRHCVRNDGPNSHFFLGTTADNLADMRAKGRQAMGDRHGMRLHPERRPVGERSSSARLTAEVVTEIRRLYATNQFTQAELGGRFGISGAHVGQIVRWIRWTHL